jgi:hypothetical protein
MASPPVELGIDSVLCVRKFDVPKWLWNEVAHTQISVDDET